MVNCSGEENKELIFTSNGQNNKGHAQFIGCSLAMYMALIFPVPVMSTLRIQPQAFICQLLEDHASCNFIGSVAITNCLIEKGKRVGGQHKN